MIIVETPQAWEKLQEPLPYEHLQEARVSVIANVYFSTSQITFPMHSSNRAYNDPKLSGAVGNYNPVTSKMAYGKT